jgi:hypothetical protein
MKRPTKFQLTAENKRLLAENPIVAYNGQGAIRLVDALTAENAALKHERAKLQEEKGIADIRLARYYSLCDAIGLSEPGGEELSRQYIANAKEHAWDRYVELLSRASREDDCEWQRSALTLSHHRAIALSKIARAVRDFVSVRDTVRPKTEGFLCRNDFLLAPDMDALLP